MANGTGDRCVCLDTRAFDKCIKMKENFIARYAQIGETYEKIVKDLDANWDGLGAQAFISDAQVIRKNITGIADILSAMCSALEDLRVSYGDCDRSLAEFNRDPQSQQAE